MKREAIRKLLGGYATGTLTEQERKALFAAALEDQRLFDALADEEALRELLRDEGFRRELAASLEERRPGLIERMAGRWRRPLPLAVAGGLAAVVLAVVIVRQAYRPPEPVAEIAMARKVEPKAAEAPAAPQAVSEPEVGAAREQAPPKRVAAPTAEASEERREKDEMAARSEKAESPAERQELPSAAPAEAVPAAPEAAAAQALVGERADIAARPRASAPRDIGLKTAASGRAVLQSEGAGALTVRVERRRAEGAFEAVSPEQPLERTDSARLVVRAASSGQLYVFELAPSGRRRLLFTSPVAEGGESTIPVAPPAEAGPGRLLIVLSATPLPASSLEAAGKAGAGPAASSRELVLTWR